MGVGGICTAGVEQSWMILRVQHHPRACYKLVPCLWTERIVVQLVGD